MKTAAAREKGRDMDFLPTSSHGATVGQLQQLMRTLPPEAPVRLGSAPTAQRIAHGHDRGGEARVAEAGDQGGTETAVDSSEAVGAVPSRYGRTFGYRTIIGVFRPVLVAGTRHEWGGVEHLPTDRGFLVVANHVTLLDPATLTQYLWTNGFPPYFLTKEGVFRVPVLGWLMRGAQQIPVYRGAAAAAESLTPAVAALAEGKVVVIFPEGTTTKDPARWPMAAKTGAARLALLTGCPVIPVGQWGTESIMPRGQKIPDLVRRHKVHVLAGPPVDLSDLLGREDDPAAVHEATERIMDRITALVEHLRGQRAPLERYDPHQGPAPATLAPA